MRILTLSTYPIDTPRHGGQHRLRNIVAAYRGAGCETQSVGILGSDGYPPAIGFLPFPAMGNLRRTIARPFLMEDWAIGQLAATDRATYESLCAMIEGTPDCIHVEQPWMFAFACRYASEASSTRIRLVYGSANVEHALKRKILAGYTDPAEAEASAARVLQCETEAAATADLVVATSQADAAWLAPHARAAVILAPNGVAARTTTHPGVAAANSISGGRRTALYCASAHPPNIFGFYAVFGQGLGCIAGNERIVVAGGAGASIKAHPRFGRTPGLASRYVDAGEVSEDCLQGLLETCHTVVLPITEGGGTNLKTAEALWSGRWVVAMSVAMRGFERYSTARGVQVARDAAEFKAATFGVMRSAPLRLSAPERILRQPLLWDSTLSPLTRAVAALGVGDR